MSANGDARFFRRTGPHPLARLAEIVGCPLPGDAGRAAMRLTGVATLGSAGPGEVSFLENRRYAAQLEATAAGAVVVHPEMAARVPPSSVPLLSPNPYEAWARVVAFFHPMPAPEPGIHPTALVSPGARVDPSAEVGPYAVIREGCEVGPRCRIGEFVSLGRGVAMGADCRIGSHASLSHAVLGDRVGVQAGARLGQEGFGFARSGGGYLPIPHIGRVLVGDDVEIGNNTTIDRGSTGDTVIGAGSRIDNLVQIGHNVRLGRGCIVVAQVGIAGSTVLEDFVQLGGQAALAGHLTVGRGARIGAQAGVISDVPPGAALLGSPAQPRTRFFRQVAAMNRLAAR